MSALSVGEIGSKARMEKLTPEKRSEFLRKAGRGHGGGVSSNRLATRFGGAIARTFLG